MGNLCSNIGVIVEASLDNNSPHNAIYSNRDPSFALFLSVIGLTFVLRARSAVDFASCSVL